MVNKICFAASSGGHLEEASRLKNVIGNRESILITEKGIYNELKFCDKVYYVKQINRKEMMFIPKFLLLGVNSLKILLKEKPDCIISTGALASYPICILGKLLGKKLIYIESFARIDTPSLTGKLIYRFADLFIVQWEEMLKIYPGAVYGGGIF